MPCWRSNRATTSRAISTGIRAPRPRCARSSTRKVRSHGDHRRGRQPQPRRRAARERRADRRLQPALAQRRASPGRDRLHLPPRPPRPRLRDGGRGRACSPSPSRTSGSTACSDASRPATPPRRASWSASGCARRRSSSRTSTSRASGRARSSTPSSSANGPVVEEVAQEALRVVEERAREPHVVEVVVLGHQLDGAHEAHRRSLRTSVNHSATGMKAAPASEPAAKRARRTGSGGAGSSAAAAGAGSAGGSPARGLTAAIATA